MVRQEAAVEDKAAEVDEENLRVGRLQGAMRQARRGIKKCYAREDESYIEIILP